MSFRLRCTKPFAKSCFLPGGYFEQDFRDRSIAVASAIEAMPEDDTLVQVVDTITGKVVWDSSKEEFEE